MALHRQHDHLPHPSRLPHYARRHVPNAPLRRIRRTGNQVGNMVTSMVTQLCQITNQILSNKEKQRQSTVYTSVPANVKEAKYNIGKCFQIQNLLNSI